MYSKVKICSIFRTSYDSECVQKTVVLRLPCFENTATKKTKNNDNSHCKWRKKKDLDIPTRGIEPRAGVWETPMLAITPYRSGLANYAFWFNFDPRHLASCVSCTSVRASISLTQPTSEVLASFNWLALFSWFQPSHVLWTKHVLQLPSTTISLNKSLRNLWFEGRPTVQSVESNCLSDSENALWAQEIIKVWTLKEKVQN